jgi:hypothetical protein
VTYLLPAPNKVLSTKDLIVRRAKQLQRQITDIDELCKKVHRARQEHMHRFAINNPREIKNFVFKRGDLVLVRNTAVKKSLDCKMHPRYLGPYIIISRNTGGVYILAELDGTILKNTIGAFHVIPYHSRKSIPLPNIFDTINISSSELHRREQLNEQDDEFITKDFYDTDK